MNNTKIDEAYDYGIKAQLKRTLSKKQDKINEMNKKLDEKRKITALKKEEINEKNKVLNALEIDCDKMKSQLTKLKNENRIDQDDFDYLNHVLSEYENEQKKERLRPWVRNVIRTLTYEEHYFEIEKMNRKISRIYENIENENDLISEKEIEITNTYKQLQNEIKIRSDIIDRLIEMINQNKLDSDTFCDIAIFLAPPEGISISEHFN